jgi:hypothetical protein
MRIRLAKNLRMLEATLYVGLVACSSAAPIDGKGPEGKSATTVNKSNGTGDPDDPESAQADSAQEIAGGFLTCAYVSTEESGFSQSDEYMPVGCAVRRKGRKVSDPGLSYQIGLYDSEKMPDRMETKSAPAASKWHGFGHLPRAKKTNYFLGMAVTNRETKRTEGPVYFPVRDLLIEGDASSVSLNLVGPYVSSGLYNMGGSIPQVLQDLAALGGINFSNETTPILPAAACSSGHIHDKYDLSKYNDPIIRLGDAVGSVGESQNIDVLKQNRSLTAEKIKPKTVECFVMVKEADRNNWGKSVGTPQAVLEGEGCLFLQSKIGFVIYDRAQIEKYNIKKDFLETYVKARMCLEAK